jgi:hypothetical protein
VLHVDRAISCEISHVSNCFGLVVIWSWSEFCGDGAVAVCGSSLHGHQVVLWS